MCLFFLQNIQAVIRSPDQILTLTGQQMILHPSGKGFLVHGIHQFPHIFGGPVCSNQSPAFHGQLLCQRFNPVLPPGPAYMSQAAADIPYNISLNVTLSSFGTACAPPSLGNKKDTCIRLYRYPKIHASQIHFPLQGDSDISNLAGIGICTVGSSKQAYAKKTDGSPADCIKNPLF